MHIHMNVYTHVDVPKCINTYLGMTPFTQSSNGGNSRPVTQRSVAFVNGRLTEGYLVGGLSVVVIATVALAPLFTTDHNCLRKAVFHSELSKQTQIQSEGIWGCAHRDLRRWPRQEDGKPGSWESALWL